MIEIPLVNDRGLALIDDEDAGLVTGRRWYLTGTGYAAAAALRGKSRTLVCMHRLLLDPPASAQVDHVNRDKLDNRRANLRVATRSQNQGNAGLRSDNTSGFRG